jgi:aspartyl-tRNA(Asn)/glutamyl-tRNA(Gln) amidotransferase subunit A
MFGSFVLSSDNYDVYYRKAMQIRTLVKDAYTKLFERFDLILSPVVPAAAPEPGGNLNDSNVFTTSANLAGLPAAALPCGFDKQGLPVGFQLIGKAFSEGKLIEAARVYQNSTDNKTKKPGAST